jgi:hypothetical protein
MGVLRIVQEGVLVMLLWSAQQHCISVDRSLLSVLPSTHVNFLL